MSEKLPCCICGSDKVVVLAKYVHPMCKECWEKYKERLAKINKLD